MFLTCALNLKPDISHNISQNISFSIVYDSGSRNSQSTEICDKLWVSIHFDWRLHHHKQQKVTIMNLFTTTKLIRKRIWNLFFLHRVHTSNKNWQQQCLIDTRNYLAQNTFACAISKNIHYH